MTTPDFKIVPDARLVFGPGEVFEAARSDNVFCNTFLDLARQGRVFGRMKDLVLALMHGSETAVRQATRRLFLVGGSSGADLGTGFYMTVCNL